MGMTDTSVEVQCPVITLVNSWDRTSLGRCEGKVVVGLVWEPPDPHYGADADGNRGMYVAGYWSVGDIPPKCDVCGFEFTPAGIQQIEKDAAEQAESFDIDPRWDGPDDDE